MTNFLEVDKFEGKTLSKVARKTIKFVIYYQIRKVRLWKINFSDQILEFSIDKNSLEISISLKKNNFEKR